MDYIVTIQKAIASGDLTTFNAAVQQVTAAKIAELRLDEDKRLRISPLLENITVPVHAVTEITPSSPSVFWPATPMGIGVIGLVTATVAILLSMYIGAAWGIALSAVIFAAYAASMGMRRPEQPTVRQTINANPAEVERKIDAIIEAIRIAAAQAAATTSPEPTTPPLFDVYPNVVRWLQTLYAAQYEFDEDGRRYLFKIIPRLLGQMYYNVVDYDGANVAIFETDRDSSIDGTEQIYPAIVDTRTSKVVLKGRVCNP